MKTLPQLLTAPVLGIAFAIALPASAEDAQSIFQEFESKKAEALSAYLEANPDAADTAVAQRMLVNAYLDTGEYAKAAPLLRKRYDDMEKGSGANLQELIGGVIQPLFQIYKQTGEKEKAVAFLEQAKTDLAANPQAAGIGQLFDQMASRLAMPGVGETMEIAFTSVEGEAVDLSQMKGKVVLVDFWATWCPPCIAELPHIKAAYEKYHDRGFEVIGISLDQDVGTLQAFVEQRGLPWPQYLNGSGEAGDIATKYKVEGIPATFLFDEDGKIVATDLVGNALERQLAGLLGE